MQVHIGKYYELRHNGSRNAMKIVKVLDIGEFSPRAIKGHLLTIQKDMKRLTLEDAPRYLSEDEIGCGVSSEKMREITEQCSARIDSFFGITREEPEPPRIDRTCIIEEGTSEDEPPPGPITD